MAEGTEMYDIGLLGVWYGCNYGSIMTYYALERVLSRMGQRVLMIDKPIVVKNDVERLKTHSRRFAEEHYDISERYSLENMDKLNDLCKSFVVGSDQVWNYGVNQSLKKTFYLDFVKDDKKKIAYASSFGHAVDFTPESEKKEIAYLMSKFDGISVREADGVRLCRESFGIRAHQVLDPVFLASSDIYDPLIQKSEKREIEPYVVTYILDPTLEKREAIQYVCKELGNLKAINMLDGLPWNFEKNKKNMALPECVENLQVEDWLYYLKHARYVITDSCHGASFALIFQKDFVAIMNKGRGFSRFQSLGDLFEVQDHIVGNAKSIIGNPGLLSAVNYEKVNAIMERERQCSNSWLSKVVLGNKKSVSQRMSENVIGTVNAKAGGITVTSILREDRCIGCGACLCVCPFGAIELKQDEWGYYRSHINYDKCVECGKCAHICAALNPPAKTNSEKPDLFAFAASDPKILGSSSSGGIFPLLAIEVFQRNGCVVGAAWREDYSVEHVMINNIADLFKIQKSKYLQSYMGDIFQKVKEKLKKNVLVLFSGCPCQVAGLKAYLGQEYDNLLAVDLLCGNAPSTKFFKMYLQDEFPDGIKKYEFRHKVEGYNSDCLTVTVTVTDGSSYVRRGGKQDSYQRVYHNHTMCPPHCEHCQYQSVPRYGDLTIGDFWGLSKKISDIDTKRGVSAVLCNNEKGKRFFEKIPKVEIGLCEKVPLDWLGGNGYAIKGSHNYSSPKRNAFYDAILKMSFRKAINYALKPNHGVYKKIYDGEKELLRYDSSQLRFRFDGNVWDEKYVNGKTVLNVKTGQSKRGNYAIMPLSGALEKGQEYLIRMRFQIRTTSDIINFHIKDSGSNYFQVIASINVKGKNNGKEWVTVEKHFQPDADFYDEFMIGALHVSGEDNCLVLDYIHIYA